MSKYNVRLTFNEVKICLSALVEIDETLENGLKENKFNIDAHESMREMKFAIKTTMTKFANSIGKDYQDVRAWFERNKYNPGDEKDFLK